MKRSLFRLLTIPALLLPVVLFATPASAEDSSPPLPPPAHVQDSPAALETVAPPPASEETDLGDELSAPDGDANVQIYSSTREDGTRVEEYSRHGQVYMVKVSPPHGMPPYYLYDNNGDGQFERRLGGNKRPTPPEWVIKRF